ncbi:MAG: IS21-like element helper ATPase IstB [Alicyclobacillus sp.]|nr:IS21-like element helper ATPase IstB [Alicyclobacillus sp.]
MWTEQSVEKLRQMKLHGMAEALIRQSPQENELSFEERFALLVDAEWSARENRRLTRLLKEAKLKIPQACLEDIDYTHPRGLDKSLLRSFMTGSWLHAHHNILITGPTGVGKSFMACALGNFACRQGKTVRYFRSPRLMTELAMAHGDGSFPRLISKLAKIDVLILDDFGLSALTPAQSSDFMELIDDRSLAITIVTSQLPTENWYTTMGDPTIADAVLDRLVHNAYKIKLTGESMRKIRGFTPAVSTETYD